MDLAQRIDAMWKRRGANYQPRTRHLDCQGRPRFTNRLFLETSPYLLQHAHNPVDWYPWAEEAFEAARRLGRPVLLSVGYSTCHWCHVMEEESFEDEEIAQTINDHYIPVKVDREERPDIDAVYLSAVQTITGRGGWPMTVWLTPDKKPFYGGTYFPARDGDRGAAMGFLTLLVKIRDSYEHRRELVDRSADELARSIHQVLAPAAGRRLAGADLLERTVAAARQRFDSRHGGIRGAPKFPGSLPIRLLLRHYYRTGDKDCLNMASLTLERMAAGGLHDQIGGGFHRYSTDERWLVPHFEKMLYDNALLVPAFIDGWQATGNPWFRQVARSTLDYVTREMTSPEGAFYSASDADSLTPAGKREEGYFFTWTQDELVAALGRDATIASHLYGVTGDGNFEGRHVLHRATNRDTVAVEQGLSAEQLDDVLIRINQALYDARRRRPAPLRDEKCITAWNGLMISAFARAGIAFGDTAYVEQACRATDVMLSAMVDDGRLKRSFNEGISSGTGFLEDYAFLTAALLDLFVATATPVWLEQAISLDRVLRERFEDPRDGTFFMTPSNHEVLIAREKPCLDGAIPSGNAVAFMNLLRLYTLTLDKAYYRRAERGLTAFSAMMAASPLAFGDMLLALDDFLHPPSQVIGIAAVASDAAAFESQLRRVYLPGCLVMTVTEAQAERLADIAAAFDGKRTVDGRAAIHVCRHGKCDLPITDLKTLQRQIEAAGVNP